MFDDVSTFAETWPSFSICRHLTKLYHLREAWPSFADGDVGDACDDDAHDHHDDDDGEERGLTIALGNSFLSKSIAGASGRSPSREVQREVARG